MLTGQRPWEGDTAASVAMARLAGPVPGSGARRPGISPELAAITRKALALEPDDRWPSAGGLRRRARGVPRRRGDPGPRADRRRDGARRRGRASPGPARPDRRRAVAGTRRRTPCRRPPGPTRTRSRTRRTPTRATRRRPASRVPASPTRRSRARARWSGSPGSSRSSSSPSPASSCSSCCPAATSRPARAGHRPELRRPVVHRRPAARRDARHRGRPGRDRGRPTQPRSARSSPRIPPPGAEIDPTTPVKLTVAVGVETVAVPDLRNKTEQEAFQLLFTAGLAPGTKTEVFDPVVPVGRS